MLGHKTFSSSYLVFFKRKANPACSSNYLKEKGSCSIAGHINGHYVSPRDSKEFGFIASWSVERMKSLCLLQSRVFICLRQQIKWKERSSTPSDLQTADDIKHDCSEQEGIPGCAALSCYDVPSNTFQASFPSHLLTPSLETPQPTNWACPFLHQVEKSASTVLLFCGLWSHLLSHRHFHQRGRTNRDHAKFCSMVHTVVWTSRSPGTPHLWAFTKCL